MSELVPKHRFDELKQAEFCAIVGIGCSRRRAAVYVGINPDSVYKIVRRNAVFRRRLLEAEKRPRMFQVADPRKRPVGGQELLDPVKRKNILAMLYLGCTRRAAASVVGCAPGTIYNTAQRDAEFAKELRDAEGGFRTKHLKRIDDASKETKYWPASKWSLERRYPDEFGQRGAKTYSADQLANLLRECHRIIREEVHRAELRRRLSNRVRALRRRWRKQIMEQQP